MEASRGSLRRSAVGAMVAVRAGLTAGSGSGPGWSVCMRRERVEQECPVEEEGCGWEEITWVREGGREEEVDRGGSPRMWVY